MRISILQVGVTPEKLLGQFERIPPQFEAMLTPVMPDAEFETILVVDGAPLPAPESLEAIIVTGSAFGVYDQPDWMEPMCVLLRRAYDLNIPTLGICFGHQLIAHALGGDVRKSEKGWGIGRHVYDVDTSLLGGIATPATLAIAASHQDQVITPPDTAKPFLSSDFTPNAGLVYDNGAMISMQPHPEFELDYSKALCRLRLDNPLSAQEVAACEGSLDAKIDNEDAARLIATFLRRAAAQL